MGNNDAVAYDPSARYAGTSPSRGPTGSAMGRKLFR